MPDFFERIITSDNFHFRFACGNSLFHGEEFHDHDEIIYYMGGGARFISKNVQAELTPGSIVFVPRETFHQFVYHDEDNYLRCIFQFHGEGELSSFVKRVVGETRVVHNSNENVASIFNMLISASDIQLSAFEKENLLSSAFSQLIMEHRLYGWKDENTKSFSSITAGALKYIEKNYSVNLSLADIASSQHVSVSQLSHTFKRDLAISVCKYINEMRLSKVRELVKDGTSLSHAAYLCGFKDYSSFFRFYKNKYGKSPQEKIKMQK